MNKSIFGNIEKDLKKISYLPLYIIEVAIKLTLFLKGSIMNDGRKLTAMEFMNNRFKMEERAIAEVNSLFESGKVVSEIIETCLFDCMKNREVEYNAMKLAVVAYKQNHKLRMLEK